MIKLIRYAHLLLWLIFQETTLDATPLGPATWGSQRSD